MYVQYSSDYIFSLYDVPYTLHSVPSILEEINVGYR